MKLTTLLWVLVRVVSTIVLSITLPAQRFTKGVVALELVQGAVSTHWSTEERRIMNDHASHQRLTIYVGKRWSLCSCTLSLFLFFFFFFTFHCICYDGNDATIQRLCRCYVCLFVCLVRITFVFTAHFMYFFLK